VTLRSGSPKTTGTWSALPRWVTIFSNTSYVHPEAQNQGVGATLLTVAKERRPRNLRLWVFQKNVGARRFYERHGFSLVRLTDGRGNEELEPDALYEWRP
jgi:ribosomal protein S18 acetylase RimI-like enzyme